MSRKNAVAAIILAGGSGQRMGGNYKQFLRVKNKPIVFYSLDELTKLSWIKKIVVVVPESKWRYALRLVSTYSHDPRIRLIMGGVTRKLSIFSGLKYLVEEGLYPDYVIFHDAARPLISVDMIREVFKGAKKYGGAVVGIRSPDLILDVRGGIVSQTMDKGRTYCGYTPQCFRFESILDAHQKSLNRRSLDNADNIQLLRTFHNQLSIKVVDKFYPNPKLTYKADLKMVRPFLI